MATPPQPSKSEIAINWIGHGMLRVHLDPRPKEVLVPALLRKHHAGVLEWGFDLPRPIYDLKINADAISGTLSFPGNLKMFCYVPWSAVFALSSPFLDRSVTWLADAPIEVQREMLANANGRVKSQTKENRRHVKAVKSHLRIVKGAGT